MKRLVAALLLLMLCAGCGKPVRVQSDFFAMNTFMSISIDGAATEQSKNDALLREMEQRVNEIDRALTRTQQSSDIYALNHANGQAVTVSADTYAAIEQAVSFAVLTDGAFDPTTAALTDLWKIGTEDARVPDANEIETARQSVDYRNIALLGDGQVRLNNGAKLDLGGIGKGFATDAIGAHYRAAGSKSGVLAVLGGNIGAFGDNPSQKEGRWTLGIADPDDNASYLATVAGKDITVVTSGDYERFFEQDGVRYHHIFDPQTGYPANSDLRSVTVIEEQSALADALSTALFVMGSARATEFCAQNNIAAIFVKADKTVTTTAAVQARCTFSFEGEERSYTYVE